MSTLIPTRPLPPVGTRPPAVEPGLAAVTVLAVAIDAPQDGSAHRVELAAVALRHTGAGYAERGRLRCLLHAGMPAALIAEHCRLPVDQVYGRAPAAVALSVLERHLTAPPYLVVAHHAGQLTKLITRHLGECPTLAATPVLDTAHLARQLLPAPHAQSACDLAGALEIPRPQAASRTTQDAALIAAAYPMLIAAAVRRQPLLDLPALLRLGRAQDEIDPPEWRHPDTAATPWASRPCPPLRGPHA